jgi:hypothetical protein
MAYETPKNDFNANTGMSYDDANRVANDVIYLKGKTDDYGTHKDTAAIHKTSEDIRKESGTPLIVELRTSDPASPVNGQIWLRTDL